MMRHAQFIVLAVSLFALAACDESVPLGPASSDATGLEDGVYARGDELISSKGKPYCGPWPSCKDGGGEVATFTVEVFFDGSGETAVPAGTAEDVPAHEENTLEVTDLNLNVAFLNGVNGCSVSFDEASIDGPGRFFIYVSRDFSWVHARHLFVTDEVEIRQTAAKA